MDDVLAKEIEAKTRTWKQEYDDYAVLEHQTKKAKELADNTASQLAASMEKAGATLHKTFYGKVTLDNGELAVSGHPANYKVPPKKTRKKTEAKATPML